MVHPPPLASRRIAALVCASSRRRCFLAHHSRSFPPLFFPTGTPLPRRANAQQPKLFVGMILILIFAEALALYGVIVGIILSSRAGQAAA